MLGKNRMEISLWDTENALGFKILKALISFSPFCPKSCNIKGTEGSGNQIKK